MSNDSLGKVYGARLPLCPTAASNLDGRNGTILPTLKYYLQDKSNVRFRFMPELIFSRKEGYKCRRKTLIGQG
jgi:hypothetical protein